MSSVQLLILAAGMGSRFGGGGVKQAAPIDNDGCFIIDYSIYDALSCGIDDVVIVIKKEMERDFRETVGKRVERRVNVTYAFQDANDLPPGYSLPAGRVKPWGTGHAVLAARNAVSKPFIIINADDFYGRNAYVEMERAAEGLRAGEAALAGYKLGDCLSEQGAVSRGICRTECENLVYIEEHTGLSRAGESVTGLNMNGESVSLPLDSFASLNMFAFDPSIFMDFSTGFKDFLRRMPEDKALTSEFYLPFLVQERVSERRLKTAVIPVKSRWHGMTYRADLEALKNVISEYKELGAYPAKLWND